MVDDLNRDSFIFAGSQLSSANIEYLVHRVDGANRVQNFSDHPLINLGSSY